METLPSLKFPVLSPVPRGTETNRLFHLHTDVTSKDTTTDMTDALALKANQSDVTNSLVEIVENIVSPYQPMVQ